MLLKCVKRTVESDQKSRMIFSKIMQKNKYHWKKFAGPNEIFEWLHNFSNEREVYLALVLADNIMYYPLNQIRELWRLVLMKYAKLYLLSELFEDKPLPKNEEWYQDYLRDRCAFVGYGRAGKSGQMMVYYFKQSQPSSLRGDLMFMERAQFLQMKAEDLSTKQIVFLLDDFIGSGNQARAEWYRRNGGKEADNGKSFDDLHLENPHLRFLYLALVGCKEGREVIEEKTPIKVILGEELDDRFKCFSDISTVYLDPTERAEARKIMEEKGRLLCSHPLGYEDMELAIAFFHNTPDNSLPVIWKRVSGGGWVPLFERFG